ncbi:uncharacterized protein LOC128229872 [Mya arenaria]|uniref:uncharacterized protein LOC128229872 n=1 Tax=Mya arenaria TaxID=6604 RepID=UPI0022E30FC8|nr:uncharacterized protein LOC128229872 [Mya arenaria]
MIGMYRSRIAYDQNSDGSVNIMFTRSKGKKLKRWVSFQNKTNFTKSCIYTCGLIVTGLLCILLGNGFIRTLVNSFEIMDINESGSEHRREMSQWPNMPNLGLKDDDVLKAAADNTQKETVSIIYTEKPNAFREERQENTNGHSENDIPKGFKEQQKEQRNEYDNKGEPQFFLEELKEATTDYLDPMGTCAPTTFRPQVWWHKLFAIKKRN